MKTRLLFHEVDAALAGSNRCDLQRDASLGMKTRLSGCNSDLVEKVRPSEGCVSLDEDATVGCESVL